MNKQYQQLLRELFSQFEMDLQPSEDDIYAIDVDNKFQIMVGLHEDLWIQLFCQLDILLPPSKNLFGQTWPAHIQGQLDDKSIIWSQQPLEGLGLQDMQAWLKRFIDEIEHSLNVNSQEKDNTYIASPTSISFRV